jgi:hypothetical protein
MRDAAAEEAKKEPGDKMTQRGLGWALSGVSVILFQSRGVSLKLYYLKGCLKIGTGPAAQ